MQGQINVNRKCLTTAKLQILVLKVYPTTGRRGAGDPPLLTGGLGVSGSVPCMRRRMAESANPITAIYVNDTTYRNWHDHGIGGGILLLAVCPEWHRSYIDTDPGIALYLVFSITYFSIAVSITRPFLPHSCYAGELLP